MKIEEIFQTIGQSIVDSIEENWDYAILDIKYTGKSGGFSLNYFIGGDEKILNIPVAIVFIKQ